MVWCLLGISALCVVLNALLVLIYVKRNSGIRDPDTIDQTWKHIKKIKSQPASCALAYAIIIYTGTRLAIATFTNLIPLFLYEPTLILEYALEQVPLCVATYVSTVLYRKIGGINNVRFYIISLFLAPLFHLVYLSVYFLGTPFYEDTSFLEAHRDNARGSMILFAITPFATVPFFILACRKSVVATSKSVCGSGSNLLKILKPDFFVFSAIVTRLGQEAVSYYFYEKSDLNMVHMILGRLASDLSLVLFSSLISIRTVNHCFKNGKFNWHWPALLTPAFYGLVLNILLQVGIWSDPFPFLTIGDCVYLFHLIGLYGYLGAYFYLNLMDKYTTSIDATGP